MGNGRKWWEKVGNGGIELDMVGNGAKMQDRVGNGGIGGIE